MFRRLAGIAATLAILVGILPARAADAPRPPLRTMTYTVLFSTDTKRHEQTSGFSSDPRGTMTSVAGSGGVDRRFSTDQPGSIALSVVAATADGGLVVDSAFTGRDEAHPPIRVAIFRAGGLSYDPRTPLTPQEMRLLPFLARGLIADRTIAPGESWNEPQAHGSVTYRVSHVADDRATMGIDGTVSQPGPHGFDEHELGTTVYAIDVLAPVNLDLFAHVRRQLNSDETESTDEHLVATLVHDSFAKH